MQLPDCVTQKKLSTQGKCHFINFLGFLTRILHVNFMFNLIHLSLISGGFELTSIFTLYIPFCGNSVSIVSISSERNRAFKPHLAALIQVSIEIFWHSYTWNLKHLHMCKLHLSYTVQVSWHDVNLKLTLGILLINEVDQWFY